MFCVIYANAKPVVSMNSSAGCHNRFESELTPCKVLNLSSNKNNNFEKYNQARNSDNHKQINALREGGVIKLHNNLMFQCRTHLHLKLSKFKCAGLMFIKALCSIILLSLLLMCLLKP